jgi:succinate dehydrogenase/fumarate reductase flavoprotein subunit
MIQIDKEVIETDVLVVGGGIAGLMAAINAADQGARVVVAEKANTKRSGSGATGNDHFTCYIPSVHGPDMAPIVTEVRNSLLGGYHDNCMTVKFLEQSFDRVKDWERWGISMKPTGKWEFIGHAFPGRPRVFLKYAGDNQKPVLTHQAKKRGVRIENHLPVIDVITNKGEVVGAIGLSVKDEAPVLKLIHAKAVVLATGTANRLYPSISPGWMFNTAFCPSCTGGAQAIAFRAGAKLVNMEFPNKHAGPKYFARAGKATWIGVLDDTKGVPVGPFVTKPTKELGDITADVWNSVFTDMYKSGRGPTYMDCTGIAESDLKYMIKGLEHEGNTAMLKFMAEDGIDVRQRRVEFAQYEPFLIGRGVEIDLNGETNIAGLYAAGDPVGNFRADIAGAATFGWIAGGSAAQRAKKVQQSGEIVASPVVKERARFCSQVMAREEGASWQEANLALQQIMNDYAGTAVRSETLMGAGLKYLRDLRKKAVASLRAEDSHTLMRCLETLDLMQCGELILLTALERKETRALHVRSDYTFTNPLLQDKFITVRQEKGKIRIDWRDRK